MPVIPPELLRSLGFLYASKDDAAKNAKGSGGGSAFLIGKPMDGVTARDGGPSYLIYAVSNRHVVRNRRASVLRLNRRDGANEVIELRPNDWIVHPDGCDLAAVYLSDRLDLTIDDLRFVELQKLLTEAELGSLAVNPGDEIFMAGRFVHHQGDADNIRPAVRLGAISMMPQPIYNSAMKRDELSFAVEMRSRAGFSGSPVAVYRHATNNPFNVKGSHRSFWRLLGVNWGYIFDEKGDNSYLNGVVPAWRILDVLNVPILQKKHDEYTEFVKSEMARKGCAGAAIVAEQSHENQGDAGRP